MKKKYRTQKLRMTRCLVRERLTNKSVMDTHQNRDEHQQNRDEHQQIHDKHQQTHDKHQQNRDKHQQNRDKLP